MAGSLKDVISRVRSLVGDPDGDFTTAGYLLPLITQVYDQQMVKLEMDGSELIEAVVVIPSVALGTATLSAYQAETMTAADGTTQSAGPLFGLSDPYLVEWKPAGQPETQYAEAVRQRVLPDVIQAGNGMLWWEWRAETIYMTPLAIAADLRVRGDFFPSALLDEADRVAERRMVAALAYGVAALIGIERGNDGWKQDYGDQAKAVLDDVANLLVRAEQGVSCRVGRSGRR